jgi:hypothetical protein
MRKLFFAALLLSLTASQAFGKAKITIVNNNAPGIGFNDATPAVPVGGNPGTTLGQQRLNAFKEAARLWSETIDSPVEIRILASLEPLACTPTSGVLGSTGILYIWSDFEGDTVGQFPGPEFSNTWYGSALANKRAGQDLKLLDPTVPAGASDMRVRFNSELGTLACLTGQGWYYGFDLNTPPNQLNLVTVMLHEYSHGFNFSQFASVTNGSMPDNMPDIYNHYIFDNTTGKYWPEMTNAERVSSAINSRRVAWTGPLVTAAVPSVLSKGVPTLRVNTPASIAGPYEVGLAAFGSPLSSSLITSNLVLGLDDANAAGPTTNDGCTALTNPADVAGKIAVLTRGTCGFVIKAKNAQNAGAIAVVIADNAPGSPPAGMAGVDPTVTIPAVRISLPDATLIKAQIASGVNASLGLDLSRTAGADANNHALLYTPSPVVPGSTISHYDDGAIPNQLMEFAINADLTHDVQPPKDLTLPLLRDIGWFADNDNDGVVDAADLCSNSDLTAGSVLIGSCDTTVPNYVSAAGCSVRDLVTNAAKNAKNHGSYVSTVAHIGDILLADGIITSEQKDTLQSCAARAK